MQLHEQSRIAFGPRRENDVVDGLVILPSTYDAMWSVAVVSRMHDLLTELQSTSVAQEVG